MSRAYRIRIADSVRRHVTIEDGVCTSLDVLPLLGEQAMEELLRDELLRRGFAKREDGFFEREQEGVTLRVDAITRQVSVIAKRDATFEAEHDAEVRSVIANEGERARVEGERVREALERTIEGGVARTRRELSAVAADVLEAKREELDAISTAVTRAALEKKASQLGEIRSIEEDASTGSLTIRVRVG